MYKKYFAFQVSKSKVLVFLEHKSFCYETVLAIRVSKLSKVHEVHDVQLLDEIFYVFLIFLQLLILLIFLILADS